jgi:hypothetical protein
MGVTRFDIAQWVPMCSCLTDLPAVSDPRKVESNPGKHESCPIRVHSLILDHGWRDAANPALTFIKRFL